MALHGRVTEAATHEPVAFATIFLKEKKLAATTDDLGNYVIANLCPGDYLVSISHLECAHFEQKITLNESSVFDFELKHLTAEIGEVVVREKAVELQKAQSSATVSAADLAANQGKNLGETLKNLPGVTLLNTGATIAKPVIEGLHSNRIAILTNGIPLEGQQWGSEHAPEIDPFTAGKITVVKGAASVKYGTGAMGGVVIVEPAPLREKPGIVGWAILGGYSNGRAANVAGDLDFFSKNKKWPLAGRVQATWKNAGNLHAPGYFLGNSGVAELDFSTLFSLKKNEWAWELAVSRFSQKIGILKASHIGNLTDLKTAIASPVPLKNDDFFSRKIDRPNQQIEHNLLKVKGLHRINQIWKADFQYAFQYNRREEFDRTRGKNAGPNIRFDIFTNSLDAGVAHFPIKHWQGSAGIQAVSQQNLVYRGALIPDFTALNGAIWAVERWRRFPHPLEYEIGARYDYRWQAVSRTGVFRDTLDEILRFRNASATGGIIWRFSKNGSLTANSGLAWRPPHVNELYAAGVHHGAATFEQGRSDLVPEKAWNSNLSLDWAKTGRFRVNSTAFFNRINHFIFLEPSNEFVLTVRGAFPKYIYQQSDAVLAGGDLSLEIELPGGFSFETKGSLVRGFQVGDSAKTDGARPRDWLPLMPADRVSNGFKFVFPKKWGAENGFVRVTASSVAQQKKFDPAIEFKPPPSGFTTLGFDAGATVFVFKKKVDLSISGSNLSNKKYREYTDFFRFFADSPGANFGVRAKVLF